MLLQTLRPNGLACVHFRWQAESCRALSAAVHRYAIPALVAYNYFQAKVDSIVTELERESLRVVRSLFGTTPIEAVGAQQPRAAVKD